MTAWQVTVTVILHGKRVLTLRADKIELHLAVTE